MKCPGLPVGCNPEFLFLECNHITCGVGQAGSPKSLSFSWNCCLQKSWGSQSWLQPASWFILLPARRECSYRTPKHRRDFICRVTAAGTAGASLASAAQPTENQSVTYKVNGFTCVTCAVGLEVMP